MVYTTHKIAKFGDGLLLLYHALPILSMNKLRKTYSKIQSLTEFDLNCRNFRFRPMPYVTIKNLDLVWPKLVQPTWVGILTKTRRTLSAALSLSMATFVIKWPQSCGSHCKTPQNSMLHGERSCSWCSSTIMAMATYERAWFPTITLLQSGWLVRNKPIQNKVGRKTGYPKFTWFVIFPIKWHVMAMWGCSPFQDPISLPPNNAGAEAWALWLTYQGLRWLHAVFCNYNRCWIITYMITIDNL